MIASKDTNMIFMGEHMQTPEEGSRKDRSQVWRQSVRISEDDKKMLSSTPDKTAQYTKFCNELWDGFDALCKHTLQEIQFCKDVMKFFKKRAQIEEEYAKSLSKLAHKSQYETSLGTVNRTWEEALQHTQKESDVHTATANQMNEKVIEAIGVLIKDMESARRQLLAEGSTLNTDKNNYIEALRKSHAHYKKSSKEAEIAQLTYEQSKTDPLTKPKDLSKLEKDYFKKTQIAQMSDDSYKKRIEETNAFLELYYTEKMPKILAEFEHLETVRVHMLKANLKKYVNVAEGVPPLSLQLLQQLKESIGKIDQEADIEQLVNQLKTDNEIPEPFEYDPYVQGNVEGKKKITPGLLMDGTRTYMSKMASRWGKRSNSSEALDGGSAVVQKAKPATAVYGVPINKVMELQKESFPELQAPRVLVVLADAVFKLNGTKTEGIFRVPATVTDIKLWKDRIDEGDYDVASNTKDVHLPCALFKLWFRELPESLIPASLYDQCVDTPEKALDILEQLTPATKHTVIFAINFLQELAKPEHVDITRMSADNLAMVFAPSFLRCPYEDYQKVMAAADKEKAFVLSLFNRIPAAKFQVPPQSPRTRTAGDPEEAGIQEGNSQESGFRPASIPKNSKAMLGSRSQRVGVRLNSPQMSSEDVTSYDAPPSYEAPPSSYDAPPASSYDAPPQVPSYDAPPPDYEAPPDYTAPPLVPPHSKNDVVQ